MALSWPWCRRHIWHTTIENKRQKNRENNENNRLVRRCSIVMCPAVLTSSTPRTLHKEFYQGNNFYQFFYYNYYKSCYLGKIVSNIFGTCTSTSTVDFSMELWQMTCLSNSTHSCLVLFRDSTNLLFSCLYQRKHSNTILQTT